ncbi:type I restriction enzyme HsdR N-terminal domain-containing protein [Gangjinia marincola]|uniref:Type I restriction enzyme HsdR N-terminal domain-containing protein n=2 Tax=Gangjinia marincola TaxID=578463 RepID=A0ABP3XRW8_9FLAO
MQTLNFNSYSFRLKKQEKQTLIYDPLRKRFFRLTPEEWVRQHCIQFLHLEKGYPLSLMNAEKQLKLHDTTKRYDIICFKPNGDIHVIVECKAPEVNITQATFDQIARYNMALKSNYLMVTNGISHYFCTIDYENETYRFLNELPPYT